MGGWYFPYATLPFGWKASAYVYHTMGMASTHFIRSNGVPCSQYIGNRHTGQLRPPRVCVNQFSNFQLPQMATFVACSVLISLGYLTPVPSVRFLGYFCDSEKPVFIPPDDKRVSLTFLRESILEKNSVSLKNLQKFAGKTTSFSLLVPAAKLYTNWCKRAKGQAAS